MNARIEAAAVAARSDAERLRRAVKANADRAAILETGDFCVVAEPVAKGFWRTSKRKGQALVARQRLLETTHAAAPVLPVAPGVSFDDSAALDAFMIANGALLAEALAAYGDLEQHQIVVDLPFEIALAHLQASDAWSALAAAGAAARTQAEKRAFGADLAAAAGRIVEGLAATARTRLSAVARDVAELPRGEETTALNIALLTGREGGGALETVLEALDAEWSGALRIRMIGPSPATSFASVLAEETDLEAAADELGVAHDAPVGAVDAAYREIMRVAHPDHAGADGHERAARLSAAARVLRRSAEARAALASAGLLAGGARLARLYREGAPAG